MTLVRADRGKHRLSTGPLARSMVGRLTNEQLEDARAGVEVEFKRRLAGEGVRLSDLDVDELTKDLRAISEELALRAVGL